MSHCLASLCFYEFALAAEDGTQGSLITFKKNVIFRINRAGLNSCPEELTRLILLHTYLAFHISRLQSSMGAWLNDIIPFC